MGETVASSSSDCCNRKSCRCLCSVSTSVCATSSFKICSSYRCNSNFWSIHSRLFDQSDSSSVQGFRFCILAPCFVMENFICDSHVFIFTHQMIYGSKTCVTPFKRIFLLLFEKDAFIAV